MPNLFELIYIPPPEREEEPEDIFASAPGWLFPDDTQNSYAADPGSIMVYKSKRFGDIELSTCDPETNDERMLFSHYLWNAGLKMAELISHDDKRWSVRGETVLELGAGVGLGGIIASRNGAREVVLSDYPASGILANLRRNTEHNIPARPASRYSVEGHEWGDLDSSFATRRRFHFTRILAADCFWMPGQHSNLARSMLHFLANDPSARIYAIAGFHTGRAKLAAFFDVAQEQGLDVEEMYEEDVEGNQRQWVKEKDGGREDTSERKRWLVIARLKKR